MNHVNLNGPNGVKRACLREITGSDEQTVNDTTTATSIRLLDRLLQKQAEHDLAPGKAAELTAIERDALLSAVYQQIFGPTVESRLFCANCETPFELAFGLEEALKSSTPGEGVLHAFERDSEGVLRIGTNGRFRLPNGHDELAIQGLPLEEAEDVLLSRCIIAGEPKVLACEVRTALECLAPSLILDVEAKCPECLSTQTLKFDLQSYLLTALAQERPRLLSEAHLLASTYGWGFREILELPRSQRRAFVQLIESETDSGAELTA